MTFKQHIQNINHIVILIMLFRNSDKFTKFNIQTLKILSYDLKNETALRILRR